MMFIRTPTLRLLRAVTAAVILLFSAVAWAQEPEVEREGYFEVRSATTELIDGVYNLDARLQLVLSSEALEALNAGVPLTIELQVEMYRQRRFYPDALDAEIAVSFELEFRPLSQRYLVRNLNSGNQESFATLYSALNTLGRIQRLPIVDKNLLRDDKDYRFRVRALLNTQQYPAPLRFVFFWRNQWQLKSDWFQWPLDQ